MDVHPIDQRTLAGYHYAANAPWHGLTIDGRPALTGIDPDLVARYVLLMVRDPLCAYDSDPTEQVAALLTDVVVAGNSGMFRTITGSFRGVRVSVVSGGSGGPEAELALMDLFEHTAADTFVRVGGSGGMHESVTPGDLVIATGVVRDEGLTTSYVPASYPAVSSIDVVAALTIAARRLGAPHHLGLTRSTDSDFVGGGRPAAGGFFPRPQLDVIDTWTRAGVLNGDRESAAIVTLAQLYGKRGGSICSVADNIVTGAKFDAGSGHVQAISVALEAMTVLAGMDAHPTQHSWLNDPTIDDRVSHPPMPRGTN